MRQHANLVVRSASGARTATLHPISYDKAEISDVSDLTMPHAGDTSQNLLWRLKNGEAPEGLSPDAVVILVGTNDLSKSFITKVSLLSVLN